MTSHSAAHSPSGVDAEQRGMVIAPSLLAANFGRLHNEVQRVNASGADWLHLDIMDGNFVPNISFGPGVVKTLRPASRLWFDVHLMVSKPEILLELFVQAGADQLNVHVELGDAVGGLLWKIKALGCKAGLAINPGTPLAHAQPYLPRVDSVLIMTVNPGFGGQAFIYETLPKIQQADALRRQKNLAYRIAVDGGIDFKTAAECAHAGADTFVSGTTLFRQHSLSAAVRKMRRLVEAAANKRTPAAPTLNPLPA